MKTTRTTALVAALILCATAAFDAEAARRPKGPGNIEDAITSPFAGTVANVSAVSLTVRGEVKLKNAGGERGKEEAESHSISFSIKPETQITRNGKPAQLKDIQKGEFVSVTFTTKQGSSLKHVTAVIVGKDASEVQAPPKGERKKKKQK